MRNYWRHRRRKDLLVLCVWVLWGFPGLCYAQCPWAREVAELQSSCICAYNLGHELSVQCDMVDYSALLGALDRFARATPIDLLYVNNSSVSALEEGALQRLRVHSLQLSGCRIRSVAAGAFRGQEATLKNLNLQSNELSEVPAAALRPLARLALLDLSRNRIARVPDGAFASLAALTTLKLSDNNLTLAPGAFRGLERSLKNLNLKGTGQRRLPEAARGLAALAFLDLSQNALQELGAGGAGGALAGLDSLAALNLERNLIDRVADDAFRGVTDTLSSLSLLNNLLATFPTRAINSLRELRVLDIGYNLLAELPRDAFAGTGSLTLLALDGNLLRTVPGAALRHLNSTLRGLSLGGAQLHCDCRLRWLAHWLRRGDLQVTSRERSPQFCGAPPRLRDRSFYSIGPEELTCDDDEEDEPDGSDEDDFQPVRPAPEITLPPVPSTSSPRTTPSTTTARTTTTASTTPSTTTASTTTTPRTTSRAPPTTPPPPPTARRTPPPRSTTTTAAPASTRGTTPPPPPPPPTRRAGSGAWPTASARPPLVLAHPPAPPRGAPGEAARAPGKSPGPGVGPGAGTAAGADREVLVRSAHRQDNSVVIQWDSYTSNILGFRVVYRLFGDAAFKQGPPLEASEREFRIKNVPPQECIVVCVVSLEDVHVTPQTVPYAQCREVRTVAAPASNMDKITIAASAAICGTVVIALGVFVAASRRRSRKLHTLQQHPHAAVAAAAVAKGGASPGGGGGGAALSSLAALGAFASHKDWDQASVYSNRSIPRPRVYHMERQGSLNAGCPLEHADGGAAHFAATLGGGKAVKARSVADGQSQHSFSNHSGRYTAAGPYSSSLVSARPEIRQSRQSLAGVSDHMSRVSYPASLQSHAHAHALAQAQAAAAAGAPRRQRSRSRSRDHGARPSSRYSTAGSSNTLNYLEPTDWTDHDMDIYMARNTTTRGGLVPL